MSDSLKIKLTIAGRVYPLTIAAAQEQSLREAANKIEAMIDILQQLDFSKKVRTINNEQLQNFSLK